MGHVLSPENVYSRPDRRASIRCLACMRIQASSPDRIEAQRAARARWKAKQPKTMRKPLRKRVLGGRCKYGHELNTSNAYILPNGRVACRVCRLDSVRRYQETPAGIASLAKHEGLTVELYESVKLLRTLKKEMREHL
jgi:hypothetical protein